MISMPVLVATSPTNTHAHGCTSTDLFFIPDLVSNILSVFETILIVTSPVITPLLCRKQFTRPSRNLLNRVVGNPTTEKSPSAFLATFITKSYVWQKTCLLF